MVLSLVAYGCTQSAFDIGIKKLNGIDEKYGISLQAPPETTENIDEVINDLNQFKTANNVESLEMLADFRIKFLESQKLFIEGWQWGRGSTTIYGFGCTKGYARVTTSASIRNASAQAGFEAVDLLEQFVDNYPNEAKSVNITQKDVLFLKALYFQGEEQASKDARIIESACGGKGYNKTLSE